MTPESSFVKINLPSGLAAALTDRVFRKLVRELDLGDLGIRPSMAAKLKLAVAFALRELEKKER